jgi:hypothetical protein
MKTNILLLLGLLIVVFSCNNENKNSARVIENKIENNKLSIEGTWERTSFYNYRGDIIDSFQSSIENKHIKIFTPSKVIWCRNNSADSTEWFGYGYYKLTDSLLIETLEFGSKSMQVPKDGSSVYEFKYNLDSDTFSQIRFDSDGQPIFSENYIRVE